MLGVKAQMERVAKAIDDPEKVKAAFKDRFGFDIFTTAGWKEAGVDTGAGLVVWFGGAEAQKDWKAFVLVSVADRKALLDVAGRLAKREGAMDLGAPVAHDGGEWIPFQRTLGQKTIGAGGVFLKDGRAVFTASGLKDLALLNLANGAVSKDALYLELAARLPSKGQGMVFATRKAVVAEAKGAPLLFSPSGWIASFAITAAKLSLDSAAKLDSKALKTVGQMVPEPLAVPPPPDGTAIAVVQSLDAQSLVTNLVQVPQFAQVLMQLEKVLGSLKVDLHSDLLVHMGTTWSGWAGVGEGATSLPALLGSLFVGADIAGGSPKAFITTIKKVVEDSGQKIAGLQVSATGLTYQHQMGRLTIGVEDGPRLSVRFGAEGKGDLTKSRPQAKDLLLSGKDRSALWFDFQALAKAARAGAGMAGATPLAGIITKAADILAQADYLTVTSGMDGAYQTGHGELLMK
jgi:hypothetical protein